MLDVKVNTSVSSEARHVVHLEHPRLQFVVQHDIKPEEVAACVRLLSLARSVQVLQLRLDDHHCLDYNLLYLMPNCISLFPISAAIRARRHKLALQDITQT